MSDSTGLNCGILVNNKADLWYEITQEHNLQEFHMLKWKYMTDQTVKRVHQTECTNKIDPQ